MRDFVEVCNQILPLIPNNRMTYDTIQAITKIRDEAMSMPPEIMFLSWIKLHSTIIEIFKPEEFALQDWEKEVINILTGSQV